MAQPQGGQPRNGFTLALEYVAETVFKHRMFVVLGIESKSQSSSEKTWPGIIGRSNVPTQPYSFPVRTHSSWERRPASQPDIAERGCPPRYVPIIKYLGFKGIPCCMQMRCERRRPCSADKARDEEPWGSALSLHHRWDLPDYSEQRERMAVGRGL